MTRLTLLFVVAALVIPGAAFATPTNDAAPNKGVDVAAQDAKWRAVEDYYSSYGEPKPIVASEPAPVVDDHAGPSWFGAFGIGAALMLIAGGIGVAAGRSLRPRHLGA